MHHCLRFSEVTCATWRCEKGFWVTHSEWKRSSRVTVATGADLWLALYFSWFIPSSNSRTCWLSCFFDFLCTGRLLGWSLRSVCLLCCNNKLLVLWCFVLSFLCLDDSWSHGNNSSVCHNLAVSVHLSNARIDRFRSVVDNAVLARLLGSH